MLNLGGRASFPTALPLPGPQATFPLPHSNMGWAMPRQVPPQAPAVVIVCEGGDGEIKPFPLSVRCDRDRKAGLAHLINALAEAFDIRCVNKKLAAKLGEALQRLLCDFQIRNGLPSVDCWRWGGGMVQCKQQSQDGGKWRVKWRRGQV